jgi:hypothetical protein
MPDTTYTCTAVAVIVRVPLLSAVILRLILKYTSYNSYIVNESVFTTLKCGA